MNKDEKVAAVEQITAELKESKAVFAVDYRGISVPQAAELRTKLREADASFSVVKNRLAKRATGEVGASDLDEHLVGPTALTYIKGDPVVAAKTVSDFTKANDILVFKGGMMDGVALGVDQFTAIAKLPGVDVLRGQLVGIAASPLTGIVRTLNQLIAGLAIQLSQVAEKGLVGGDAAEAPAEEAPAEEAPAAEVEAEEAAEEAPPAGEDDAVEAESEGDEGDKGAEGAEPEADEDTKDSGDEDGSGDSDESEDDETEQAPEASGDDAEAESGDDKED